MRGRAPAATLVVAAGSAGAGDREERVMGEDWQRWWGRGRWARRHPIWPFVHPEPPAVVRPPARGPLRVATFNVGLMSTFVRNWHRNEDVVGSFTEGFTNLFLPDADAIELGERIADRLLRSPYDVVVLQELFHADARGALVSRLRDLALPDGVRYPFIRGGFGAEERTPPGNPQPMPWDVTPDLGPFGNLDGDAIGALRSLLDDSGLLVVSRLPLVEFELGGRTTDWAFARYSAAAGIDALCPKGAAAVVVEHPGLRRRVVVTCSHLQADDEHAAVRRLQLEQLVWLSRGVGQAADTDDVLVLGDLNVRGEVPAGDSTTHGGEYGDTLAPGGLTGVRGPDGWAEGTLAPAPIAAAGRFDRQLSHPSDGQRLDHVVAGDLSGGWTRSPRHLAVQHQMLALDLHDGEVSPRSPIGLGPVDLAAPRGHVMLSDHIGVSAIVGRGGPHSGPRFALPCTPKHDPTDPSPSEHAAFDDVPHGELRWLALDPGAYRIAPQGPGFGALVDLEVYDPADLSVSLADVMPPNPAPGARRGGVRFPAVDHPLLVRLHGLHPDVRRLHAIVRRIVGATPDDAVPVRPWTPTAPSAWPTPAQGGRPERSRWFEVLLDPPDPGPDQRVWLCVRDELGAALPARVEVFPGTDTGTPGVEAMTPGATLAPPADLDRPPADALTVAGSADAQRRFLVRVTPEASVADVPAVVEVRSDLRFLVAAGYVALDETGPDWSGADEITWEVRSDLHPAGVAIGGGHPDVDTNEAFPMPTGGTLAFRERVDVRLVEDGGIVGDETAHVVLPGGAEPGRPSQIDVTLPDDVSDGRYGVTFEWARVLRHA